MRRAGASCCAPLHRVATSPSSTFRSASATVSRYGRGWIAGNCDSARPVSATTGVTRPSTSGTARRFGIGVTRPTHCAASPGRQHRNRQDRPGSPRTSAYSSIIRRNVSTIRADVHYPERRPSRAAAGTEHVRDPDGLHLVLHPARGDHHGQPLRQVAHHLERRRARPDDGPRPELRRGKRSSAGSHPPRPGSAGAPMRPSGSRPPR
jgi:hypothetical protein